jgi:hypothetical protein
LSSHFLSSVSASRLGLPGSHRLAPAARR